MSTHASSLKQGMLVVLDRDRAKQLFGAREPAKLREVLNQLATDSQWVNSERMVTLDAQAELLQELLSSGDNDEPALDQAILGGRPLADEPSLRVRVVRPDMVAHVASALQAFRASPRAGQGSAHQAEILTRIEKLYAQAVDEAGAVAFLYLDA